jgi:hypothetical protein
MRRTDPCLADRALLGAPWLDNLSTLRLAHLLLLRLGVACVGLTLLWCLCLQHPLLTPSAELSRFGEPSRPGEVVVAYHCDGFESEFEEVS